MAKISDLNLAVSKGDQPNTAKVTVTGEISAPKEEVGSIFRLVVKLYGIDGNKSELLTTLTDRITIIQLPLPGIRRPFISTKEVSWSVLDEDPATWREITPGTVVRFPNMDEIYARAELITNADSPQVNLMAELM